MTFRTPCRTVREFRNVPRPVVAMLDEYEADYVETAHMHPRSQLLYCSSGVMSVQTEEGAFLVPPLRAIWIPATVVHEVICRGKVSSRMLYVDQDARPNLPKRCRVLELTDFVRALIVETTTFPHEYDVRGREGRIVELLLDEIAITPAAPLFAPLPSDQRLAKVCRAMLRKPSQGDDLNEWAQKAGVSRSTLARLFQREAGMTFSEWRQRLRLLEALSRLAAGQPVTTVAFDVGYHSPSAFTAMFRRTFGTTPTEYFSVGAKAQPTAGDEPRQG